MSRLTASLSSHKRKPGWKKLKLRHKGHPNFPFTPSPLYLIVFLHAFKCSHKSTQREPNESEIWGVGGSGMTHFYGSNFRDILVKSPGSGVRLPGVNPGFTTYQLCNHRQVPYPLRASFLSVNWKY